MERALSANELAEAMYEGTQDVANLAEEAARKYGGASALSFFGLMGDDVQNFWRSIAKQIIDHAREWEPNEGSACVLSKAEAERLKALPRIPLDYGSAR